MQLLVSHASQEAWRSLCRAEQPVGLAELRYNACLHDVISNLAFQEPQKASTQSHGTFIAVPVARWHTQLQGMCT
jgi:hypothetical protein